MRIPMAALLGLAVATLWAGPACTGPARTPRPAPPATDAPDASATSPEEDSTAEALRRFVRGRLLMVTKDHARAADELARAVALAPDVYRLHLYLGLARYDAGDPAGALAAGPCFAISWALRWE